MEGTKPNWIQMVIRWPWSPSKIYTCWLDWLSNMASNWLCNFWFYSIFFL